MKINMPILRPIPYPKGIGYFKTLFTYTRTWEVIEDYYLEIPMYGTIFIPKGFIFDGASIPKIFRNIVSPTGILFLAGLVHDFGYRYNYLLCEYDEDYGNRFMDGAGKDKFDSYFLVIANYINGLVYVNKVAYWSVKYFGGSAWRSHSKTQTRTR